MKYKTMNFGIAFESFVACNMNEGTEVNKYAMPINGFSFENNITLALNCLLRINNH